jgi:hypothetical protein
LQDAFGVLQYIIVPISDQPIPVRFDISRSIIVGRAVTVLAAVQFDRQLEPATGEIHYSVSNPELLGELHP